MPLSNTAPDAIWQPVFVGPYGVFLDDRAPHVWLHNMADCCKREACTAHAIGTRIKWFECRSCGAAYATLSGLAQ